MHSLPIVIAFKNLFLRLHRGYVIKSLALFLYAFGNKVLVVLRKKVFLIILPWTLPRSGSTISFPYFFYELLIAHNGDFWRLARKTSHACSLSSTLMQGGTMILLCDKLFRLFLEFSLLYPFFLFFFMMATAVKKISTIHLSALKRDLKYPVENIKDPEHQDEEEDRSEICNSIIRSFIQ